MFGAKGMGQLKTGNSPPIIVVGGGFHQSERLKMKSEMYEVVVDGKLYRLSRRQWNLLQWKLAQVRGNLSRAIYGFTPVEHEGESCTKSE